jgi:uncharacterized protein
MVKAPVLGTVKTRVAETVGMQEALRIYRLLLVWLFRQLPPGWPVEVHYTPESELPLLRELVDPLAVPCTYHAQAEGDLGHRLLEAQAQAFDRGAQGVIMLGADCPWLTQHELELMRQELTQAPVAIIPAEDGGYVAMGLRERTDWLFQDMPWSDSALMQATRNVMMLRAVHWLELPVLPDVDTQAEWLRAQAFMERVEATANRENSTGLNQAG